MNFLKIIIVLTLSLYCFTACKNTTEEKATDNTEEILKSSKLVDDPENEGEKMLLGLVTRDDFKSKTLFPWMYKGFESYKPDPTTILELKENLDGVTIKTFMGTWCEDSQREIPHLYKILTNLGFEDNRMQIVAVSHGKETPDRFEKDLKIEFVPTIIFYKKGEEIGRFVEYVQGESLEKDILTIVTGLPYTPAYAE